MEWSDKFSVHVNYIDRQHMRIVEYITQAENLEISVAQFPKMARDPASIARFVKILDNLIDYTKTHFRDEELLLKRHNVRNLERHKEIHKNLISQVELLRSKSVHFGFEVLPIVVKFLKEWLLTHIQGVDMGYSKFIGQSEKP